MSAMSQPTKDNRRWYLSLRPRTARILAHIGIDGAWGYFLLKFFYRDDTPSALPLIGGFLIVSAFVATLLLFFSSYSFIANAPSQEIDERELAERYRAHFYAFQYAIIGLIVGYIGLELLQRNPQYTLSPGVVENYLTTMIMTSLVMPAALLAFWDRDP